MAQPNIEKQLLNESVKQLDLREYCLVTTDTTVRETVRRLYSLNRHCAFVVGAQTRLAGILTERDILTKVVSHPETWDQPVANVMTSSPKSLSIEATAHDALELMEEYHFRNVPVVGENDAIIGNVTHFAILEYLVAHFPEAIYNLPPDPENYANQRAGG